MEVTEDEQEILSQMAIALIAVAHSQKVLAKDGKLAEKKKKKKNNTFLHQVAKGWSCSGEEP